MKYLLYDNECPFCVNIIKKITPLISKSTISYIKLHSGEGKKIIKKYDLENINSVIYIDEKDKVFIKSNAILNLSNHMIFPYNLLFILKIIPRKILDLVYDFIARNRMRIKI